MKKLGQHSRSLFNFHHHCNVMKQDNNYFMMMKWMKKRIVGDFDAIQALPIMRKFSSYLTIVSSYSDNSASALLDNVENNFGMESFNSSPINDQQVEKSQKSDNLFNFIPMSPSSKEEKPRATISRSADDYLLVMQSIISTSNQSSVEDKIVKTKHAIPSSLTFSLNGTKYRVRWWLSMLTSFGENLNREKMELFSDVLLKQLFVFPEKRDKVLSQLYGTTMEQAEAMDVKKLNSFVSTSTDIISLADLVKFYKSFKEYGSKEVETNFVKELRMVCKSQLIANYCNLKDLEMVRQVFDSVRREEGGPSIQLYNQMMSALANLSSNATEDSKSVIQEIESLYSEIESPSTQCIHTMLHAYAKFGFYIQMEELAKQLEDKNSYTFSILLYGYTVAKRFSKALEVYSTISEPRSEHIRLVVSLLLQVGLDIQGERLIQSLPESIHKLRLTNELMDLYTKSGDFESVIRLFHSLKEPDCYSLGIVMNAYVRQNKLNDSLQLFEKYCKGGIIPPNSIIYNLLLHGISLKGDFENLEKFFHQIPKHLIDQKTIVTMISAYLKKKDYKRTEYIYRHNSSILKDSIFATTLMIKCYASLGKIEKAEELYLTVKKPDLVLCNIMLDSYSKIGDMQKAYALFSGMYKRDNVSYNTILKGYAAKGSLHNAEIIFNRIDDPDAHSHLIMLNAYAEHGDAESVEKFFKMIPKKFKNSYIYTCMMKFYSKLNKVERVKYYYGLIGGNNFHADHLMMNTFLKVEDFEAMRQLQQKIKGTYMNKRDHQSRAIFELLKQIPGYKIN